MCLDVYVVKDRQRLGVCCHFAGEFVRAHRRSPSYAATEELMRSAIGGDILAVVGTC
jgi:hypothetical protein